MAEAADQGQGSASEGEGHPAPRDGESFVGGLERRGENPSSSHAPTPRS